MINFLLSLIPVCLGIWSIHILFQEGHLLEKQGQWLYEKLGDKWSKPVAHCAICMSSLYGLIGFFAIRYFFNVDLPLKQLIPFILNLAGLNTIISKLTTKERIIVDE